MDQKNPPPLPSHPPSVLENKMLFHAFSWNTGPRCLFCCLLFTTSDPPTLCSHKIADDHVARSLHPFGCGLLSDTTVRCCWCLLTTREGLDDFQKFFQVDLLFHPETHPWMFDWDGRCCSANSLRYEKKNYLAHAHVNLVLICLVGASHSSLSLLVLELELAISY